jgi:hypothetical protein
VPQEEHHTLERIEHELHELKQQGREIMSALTDLQASVARTIADQAKTIADQTAAIAALQAASGATDAALAALTAQLAAADTALEASNAALEAALAGGAPPAGTVPAGLAVSLLQGSAAITFAVPITQKAGDTIAFDAQPGVVYTLLSDVAASPNATLTAPFTGASTTTAQTVAVGGVVVVPPTNALPVGTPVLVVAGSTGISFQNPQSLKAGAVLVFSSQPGVKYLLASDIVNSLTGTLTTPYTGATAGQTAEA